MIMIGMRVERSWEKRWTEPTWIDWQATNGMAHGSGDAQRHRVFSNKLNRSQEAEPLSAGADIGQQRDHRAWRYQLLGKLSWKYIHFLPPPEGKATSIMLLIAVPVRGTETAKPEYSTV